MRNAGSIILSGFLIIKICLQYFLVDPVYELHRDEFLHLDQANHLAWGYESVPPFTSWISYIIKILGNNVFWVKFFPALFGALTILIVWKIIELLNGNIYAKILGSSCILFSALLRLNILYQPNSFEIFIWTTFYYFLIKYVFTKKTKWIYFTAIVLAIGFLNKYNIVFLILGGIPAFLLTEQRAIFLKRNTYWALLLALVIVSPNLIWQYLNNFPVVHHLSELAETQLVNVQRVEFFKDQLLFFTASIFVIVSSFYALLFHRPFKEISFIFWSFLFTLLLYSALRAKSYYSIGLYPVHIAIGSVYLTQVLGEGWRRLAIIGLTLIPVVFFIVSRDLFFPVKNPEYFVQNPERYKRLGLLRWEDGRDHKLPQDFADMLGWKELANKVDKAYNSLAHPDQTLVLCDNYGQAGAVNYYTNCGIRAISFNADYVNWFNSELIYTNLIRVKERSNRETEMMETSPFFESGILYDSITNEYAREYGTSVFVFKSAKINMNKRIWDEIRAAKSH